MEDVVDNKEAKCEVHHIRVHFFVSADRSHTGHTCCDGNKDVEGVHSPEVRLRLFAKYTAVRTG